MELRRKKGKSNAPKGRSSKKAQECPKESMSENREERERERLT